jgi:hypothetical protein
MDLNQFERILVRLSVDGELAQELRLIVSGYAPHPLGVALINGMTSHIHYNDIYNIPTKGMIYEDGIFVDGPNGETFRAHQPATDINYDLFIFLKNNEVLDFWLAPTDHPIFKETVPILKSSPTFEIVE